MSKLAILRERLTELRGRRRAWRVGTAWSSWILAAVGILAAALLIDWTFEPPRPQRFLLLCAVVAAMGWAWRKLAVPWLGRREDDLDMALIVERQQRIDSDLVAALQFESPAAGAWGSGQLETAVIDYVADFGNDIDVYEGIERHPLLRRGLAAGGALAAAALAAILFPGHAGAFLNRLLLGAAHYPTRTRIERIEVAGQQVFPVAATTPVRSPAGRPLEFSLVAAGELPESGSVRLRTVAGGLETSIELTPSSVDHVRFSGRLPRLIDSVWYEIYLGDAWTDPAMVEVIPLPVVNLSLVASPPEYAAAAAPERSDGDRQLAVLEGSRVSLEISSANKRLRKATMELDGSSTPLSPVDDGGRTWRVPAGTHLDNVTEPLAYQVQVEDEHGLSLESPIQGYIRIKADRPPRVKAELITRRVLPTARPTLTYEAADDYGIARLRVRRQIVRAGGGGQMEEDAVEIPLDGPQLTQASGGLPLDLRGLKLVKGDSVKVTLEATDYRGSAEGRTSFGEPLVLEVTDERGVLAGMIESDERAARQLDAVIQRQVGVGEAK